MQIGFTPDFLFSLFPTRKLCVPESYEITKASQGIFSICFNAWRYFSLFDEESASSQEPGHSSTLRKVYGAMAVPRQFSWGVWDLNFADKNGRGPMIEEYLFT